MSRYPDLTPNQIELSASHKINRFSLAKREGEDLPAYLKWVEKKVVQLEELIFF